MSLRKNETLTGWTLSQHICLHFWAWLLLYSAITPKSEDKHGLKVFNSTEFNFSEVTFFQNWYFSCAAWNVFPINSLGRVSAPLGPPSSGITGLHHLVHYCYIKWDCRLTKFFDITVSIIYLIVMQWRDFFRLVSVLEIFFLSLECDAKLEKLDFINKLKLVVLLASSWHVESESKNGQ